MSTYIEDAVVIVDNDYEARITIEPGYTDDRDRECLRFLLSVKDTTSELRVPNADAMTLAKRIIELALGRRVKLTIRRAP